MASLCWKCRGSVVTGTIRYPIELQYRSGPFDDSQIVTGFCESSSNVFPCVWTNGRERMSSSIFVYPVQFRTMRNETSVLPILQTQRDNLDVSTSTTYSDEYRDEVEHLEAFARHSNYYSLCQIYRLIKYSNYTDTVCIHAYFQSLSVPACH